MERDYTILGGQDRPQLQQPKLVLQLVRVAFRTGVV